MSKLLTPHEEISECLHKAYASSASSPLLILTPESLAAFLALYVPNHTTWGMSDDDSKPFASLVQEVVAEGEAHISLIEVLGRSYLIRDIQTITLRVTHEISAQDASTSLKKSKEYLREYRSVAGILKPRKYRNSMSEKLKRGETNYVLAVGRALTEELGITIRDEYLQEPYLYPVPPEYREVEYVLPGELTELNMHPSDAYPGLWTRNTLHHFIWNMPDEYYIPDGYHESGTSHYFKWRTGYVDDD